MPTCRCLSLIPCQQSNMSLYPITVGVGDNFNDEPVPTDSIALDTADNDDSSVDSTECVPLNFQWVWETDKCVRFISSDGKKLEVPLL